MARPGPAAMDEVVLTPPRFVTQLQGNNKLAEGQHAHFECRVEPTNDPKLRLEVYHNGKHLPAGSRFHVTSDFGYVALDVMQTMPSDSGEYVIKAINDLGQDQTSIHLSVEGT